MAPRKRRVSFNLLAAESQDLVRFDISVPVPPVFQTLGWFRSLTEPVRVEPGLAAAWTQYHGGVTVKKSSGPTSASYSFHVTEAGDVANPALSRTSGLTFWVAPPSAPPPTGDLLLEDGFYLLLEDGVTKVKLE